MIRPSRLRIRHLPLGSLLVAGLLVLPAIPASAEGSSTNLSCTITFTEDINPPITPAVTAHGATTKGLTGTATCTGTAHGRQVTGAGSFAEARAGIGDCSTGSGSGVFVLRIPTTGGTETVAGRYDFSHDPATETFTGDLAGSVVPIGAVGNCVSIPLTQATFRFEGTITSS